MYITGFDGLDIAHIETIAQRIIDIDFYGSRDAGETPESIINQIINNPADVFNFLLDFIDNLQA